MPDRPSESVVSRPFREVVTGRRMVRSFRPDRVDPQIVDSLVDLAARAPSAGKTQGWHLVVLEGPDTERFWDVTLPAHRRDRFGFPGLLTAPIVALPLADPGAYVTRYAEADKRATGLGRGLDAWPVPYWTVDASMAVMTLLLAAEDAGLGALFFGVFHGESELRIALGIPPELDLLGAIAIGHPSDDARRPGASASRPRRTPGEIVHRGRW